ncbi:hypothetical protein [Ureibacillus sp. FSL E2-3493]|uniref:hypothetical protein n=1 Tax=Ureibacillus sp. FSL E2-3493 TaxID=2921367 RepID=UPI00311A1285
MKKLVFSAALILTLGLAACGNDDSAEVVKENEEKASDVEQTETNHSEEINSDVEETTEVGTENLTDAINWEEKIKSIASNAGVASDKFYELETFLLEYQASAEEIAQFKSDIVEDYKSGTYLSELDNHKRMLTNIFKSYFVEKNSEGALKDFAFDYYQNLKYAYRGVDSPESEAVKANEEQMNDALKEIE